jgi:hypothetical protein
MAGLSSGNGLRQGAGAAAVGAVVALVAVLAFGRTSSLEGTPTNGQPYKLYTHCGIDEARIGNQYFAAVHPLSDGSGNPPIGWGNPYQAGTMTFMSATEVVFTDSVGHRVIFKLRPGATTFLRVCSLLTDGGGQLLEGSPAKCAVSADSGRRPIG